MFCPPTISCLPGQRPPVGGAGLVEVTRVKDGLHDLVVHTGV